MNARAPLALAALTLALAGCSALGPDYARPQSSLPGAYTEAGKAEAQAPVEREWWKLFKDPGPGQSDRPAPDP